MTDRIQELREQADVHESSCGVFRPDGLSICSCRRRLMLEALDGWEQAEQDKDDAERMLAEGLGHDTCRAQLTRLREALTDIHTYGIGGGRQKDEDWIRARIRQATQENNDE